MFDISYRSFVLENQPAGKTAFLWYLLKEKLSYGIIILEFPIG